MDMTRLIDWHDEFKMHPERWHNHGRRIAEDNCTHQTQDNASAGGRETNMRYSGYCDQCGFGEDDCEPMMNYGYPLCCLPDEDKILQIVQKTCLTVMENQETGESFLVLCGGGMDLSQSIAYAYLVAGHRIPDELVFEVCIQPCLSIAKKEYIELMAACQKELKCIQQRASAKSEQIEAALKKLNGGE